MKIEAVETVESVRSKTRRGLAALQLVLTRGNSCFSPSLHTELITAHNRTENVASVIKQASKLP